MGFTAGPPTFCYTSPLICICNAQSHLEPPRLKLDHLNGAYNFGSADRGVINADYEKQRLTDSPRAPAGFRTMTDPFLFHLLAPVSPLMNPLSLLPLLPTTDSNDLAPHCYRCYLQPSQGSRCNSVLDRELLLYSPPLAAFEGLLYPILLQRDQGCESLGRRESIRSRPPSFTDLHPSGRGAVDAHNGTRPV
jgi:hypothetical protein